MKPDWKAAYNILMDYWDYIPEGDRITVDRRLRIALDDNNMVNGARKGPLTPLSPQLHTPPRDCIKRVLKRLRDEFGYGVATPQEMYERKQNKHKRRANEKTS